MNNKTTKQFYGASGFTLVELAIVLVVIAVMLGGLMVGKDMIHASNLREVANQAYDYIAKIQKFRDKYGALPGDMPNAVQIWGSAADGSYTNGCTATEFQTAMRDDPPTATCNGNGNSTIGYYNSHHLDSSGGLTNLYAQEIAESLRMWEHLHNAGMMKQKLAGARNAANAGNRSSATVGYNVPEGPVEPGGYYMRFENELQEESSANQYFDTVKHGHILHYGANIATQEPYRSVLKPKEAYQIDQKLDDGIPNKGKIVVMRNSSQGNCTTTSGADVLYRKDVDNTALVSGQRNGCVPIFITGY